MLILLDENDFPFKDGNNEFGYFNGSTNFAPSYDEINIHRIVNIDL